METGIQQKVFELSQKLWIVHLRQLALITFKTGASGFQLFFTSGHTKFKVGKTYEMRRSSEKKDGAFTVWFKIKRLD